MLYGSAKMIIPMKANFLPKKKGISPTLLRKQICEGGEYFGQIKKDGAYYTFEKDLDGNCYLFSRVISKETGLLVEKSKNVPHIISYLNERVPNGTILVGEIYFPNGNSGNTTEIMGCEPYKALVRQGLILDDGTKEWKKAWKSTGKKMYEYKGLIHFYMHDCLMWNGELLLDKDNLYRYLLIEFFNESLELNKPSFMEFAEATFNNLEGYIDYALNNGEEGVILKNKKAFFVPDTKPVYNWIKFKIEDEADVICLGFEGYDEKTMLYDGKAPDSWEYWEGNTPVKKAYFKGWVSSIKIGVYKDNTLIDIGTVSTGLSDEICEEIKENPNSFIGKPLAVKYMEVFESKLRHGSFLRFRADDINPEECTWSKIFDI